MSWLSDLLAEPLLPTWLILVVALLLMAVPMGPAEPTALTAGALVSAGALPAVTAVLALSAGMLLGDILTYHAGGPFARRIGRHPGGAQRLASWQHHIGRYPGSRCVAVLGLRFIPGARTPSALVARGSGVGEVQFITLTAAGSLLWAGLWVVAGATLTQVMSPGLLAVILAAALLVLVVLQATRCLLRSPEFS